METNKVFKVLRQKIVDLDLMPESVLNLSELAEMFNVSRTVTCEIVLVDPQSPQGRLEGEDAGQRQKNGHEREDAEHKEPRERPGAGGGGVVGPVCG